MTSDLHPPRGQSGRTLSTWPEFWEPQRKPISTENIFQFAVGALSHLDTRPIHAPSNCYCQRHRTKSPIPTNGFFSTPQPQDLRVAAARTRFSSALHGGRVAALRS